MMITHLRIGLIIFTLTSIHTIICSPCRAEPLVITSPRPVADVLDVLERDYALLASYEDPRYLLTDRIADVTDKVRRDLDHYPPGHAPRVLGPPHWTLELEIDPSRVMNDFAGTIQRLLAVESDVAFAMSRTGDHFHVFPVSVRNRAGQIREETPLLDARITMSDVPRNGIEAIREICRAVSAATGEDLHPGNLEPFRDLFESTIHVAANREVAREVLLKTFGQLGPRQRLTWRLYGIPRANGRPDFALNIHAAPNLQTVMHEKARRQVGR
jgi:hypothetical protein